MALSPISSVRFCGEAAPAQNTTATETNTNNVLERPGAFAKQPEGDKVDLSTADKTEKKKGGHAIRNTVIGVVVAAAALVGLTKGKVINKLGEEALKDLKFYDPKKIGHYLATAGEWISKYTYDQVAKLWAKKPAA